MLGPVRGFDVERLRASLETRISRLPGQFSVAVLGLSYPFSLDISGTSPMPAASLIKLPILAEALFQMSEGGLDRDERVEIPQGTALTADPAATSGVLGQLDSPVELTVWELLRLMIVVSDNVASDMILSRVGISAVNARMDRLGLAETRVTTSLYDTDVLASPNVNPTTAVDLVALLKLAYDGRLSCAADFREMLRAQQFRQRVPLLLPSRAVCENKTGTLITSDGNRVVNDAAIVCGGRADFAICCLSQHQDSIGHASLAISALALESYCALNGLTFSALVGEAHLPLGEASDTHRDDER